ncbi:TPA: glycosyltransferase family 2 protein [Serratia fonticola]
MTKSFVNVSVIIPVYNVRQYLKEAIDSILSQTMQPYEVIIVNDGSTDDSGDYLEEHYGHVNNVKIIHTENQGLGEARNEGSRYASGDFIYYFDSDDIAETSLLQSFATALCKDKEIDIFCFSASSFLDPNSAMKSHPPSLPTYGRSTNMVFPDGISAFNCLSMLGSFYPNAWLYIFRRSLIVDNNLSFKAIIHEDEEFTPRLFFCAQKIIVSPLELFRRRVRAGSIMQTNRNEKNVVGYIESVKSLMILKEGVSSARTKKNLEERITNNLVSIINIMSEKTFELSDSISVKFHELVRENNCFSLVLAKYNPFLYRVYRAIRRRINKISYLS